MNKETKLRARPAAITLTPKAEARIAELMAKAPGMSCGRRWSTYEKEPNNCLHS